MATSHRALDWLARRHAGESAAYVAHHAGVSEDTVLRATRDFGPFPRPSRQLDRNQIPDSLLAGRTRQWIEMRRRGLTTVAIAEAFGVSRQYVGRETRDHGPYPAPEVVAEWVAARRARRKLGEVADQWGVPVALVRRETAPYGPFRPPGPRLPPGVLGLTGVAAACNIPVTRARRWSIEGVLPEPDFVTAKGRKLWLAGRISAWRTSQEG